MELDPDKLSVAERYKLLIGGIVPRPIALVSTVSPEGTTNLAPFSFFAGVCSNPMTLLFCPANTPEGREKDTLRNCKPHHEGGTGEFVVNVVTERYAARAVAAAETADPEVSEFELVELTPTPSSIVKPPRVLESPLAYECRTHQLIRINPGEPAGGNIVIGQVVRVFAVEGLTNDRMHVHPDELAAIGRMGGMNYCTTRELFELPLGLRALKVCPSGSTPPFQTRS